MDDLKEVNLENVFPFWNTMTEGQRQAIKTASTELSFRAGENVHGLKSVCTGVIVVKKGRLKGYMCSDEGKEVTLYRLFPGDTCTLTASCILKNISFDLYVEAELDSEAILIDPSVYDKISKENRDVDNFTRDIVAHRFSEAMWIMEQTLFMKLDKRLAIFLLDESALTESGIITLSHQEIADHIGTAREVVSRMLKYFAGEGLLHVSRKEILIINYDKLQKIAE